jgi:phage gp29-like protein
MQRRAAAARAQAKTVVQLPARAISVWETIPDVRTTIAQYDQGIFKMAALLADEIFRDDRINGVLSTRADALTACPAVSDPADDSRKAQKVRDALGDDNDPDGLFDEIFPDEAISDIALSGNLINGALCHIEWEARDGLVIPRLVPWHMQFVRYDWTERTYKVLTENQGEITLPRYDLNPHGDGEWFFYTPHGFQVNGWKRAMIRWIAEAFIMRRWNQADWANYNEVHGKPTKIAYVPGGKKDGEADAFFDEVDGAGSGATLKVPRAYDQNGKESGYGYGLVEALARTWDTFDKFKAALDSGIAIGVLGGNLATETSEGSFAASKEQTPVRIDRLRKDARQLQKALRQQVLYWWALRNFGDPKLAPRIRFEVEPPEDEAEEGAAYKAFGEGVAALKNAGIPIDVRAVAETKGFPLLSPEEEQAEKDEAAARAAEAMARVAGGGGNDDEEGDGPKGAKKPAPGDGKPTKLGAIGERYTKTVPLKRYEFQGFPIAVENPKGSTRTWVDPDNGNEVGMTTMQHDYGYIEGVTGADKEELDCYVGDDADAKHVYVVHQLRAPDFDRLDEDKVFLGFGDPSAAKAAFLAHRNDGDRAYGGMSDIRVDDFRAKLARRTGTGKIRAAAPAHGHVPEGLEAVMAMITGAERMILAAAPGRAKKRARHYGDRMTDNAIAEAGRVLRVDRKAVVDLVADSKNEAELRAGLRKLYGQMDPKRLTDLVFRSRVMARLAGRAQAVKRL